MMQTNIPGRAPIELPAFYENFAGYYPNCEMQTKDWLVRHARPDWTYLDCGANIGYYSILFAQLSPQGWVHAIEPTATADMLEMNLRHHTCPNVQVHRLALGNTVGRQEEKIFRIWGQAAETLECDFTTVDSFVASRKLSRVDCVKIDVDSFDFEVLQGAEQTILHFDPWIIIELSDSLALRGSSADEVLRWLEIRGYQAALVLDKENFIFRRQPATLSPIPVAVLRWALAEGCLSVVQRAKRQLDRSPDWARSDYAVRALEAAAQSPSLIQFVQTITKTSHFFPKGQLFQYAAMARHFAPDLIIELGGWTGETTAALAAGQGAGSAEAARLLSWQTEGLAAQRDEKDAPFPLVTTFARPPTNAELLQAPGTSRRILVFSNDPQSEATQQLLGCVLPAICTREHLVMLHNISDGRFSTAPDYGERPGIFALQDTWSERPDLPQLLDFIERNQLDFFSAGQAYNLDLGANNDLRRRLRDVLGHDFSFQPHWRWFSFNAQHHCRYLFPHNQ